MNIPTVVSPYEDELLVSWIFRLMQVSCIPKIEDFEKHVSGCRVRGDGFFDVTRFSDALGIPDMSPGSMLVRHTMYPEFCARTSSAEQEHILGIMTGKGERLTYTKSLSYCPDCVKKAEDACGYPVIYRFHQTVRVCPLHRIPLRPCSVRRWRHESYWVLHGTDLQARDWRFSKRAFDIDCLHAGFIRDLMHLALPLTRQKLESLVALRLKEEGIDCGDINGVQEYLSGSGFEDWFCLHEAENISVGLSRLTGPKFLKTAFSVFGCAGELAKAYDRAFPGECDAPVRERLPENITSRTDCGCGVLEIHTADGSVFLKGRDHSGGL